MTDKSAVLMITRQVIKRIEGSERLRTRWSRLSETDRVMFLADLAERVLLVQQKSKT